MVLGDSEVQLFPVAERVILDEADDFFGALQAMVSAYFVFNMQYPKAVRPVLIYLQFYIFPFKDRQSVPNCVNHFRSVVTKL